MTADRPEVSLPLPASGLYAITHDGLADAEALLAAVEAALGAGVALLQYRDKRPDSGGRVLQARQLVTLCHDYRVPCLINDDIELCLAAGADGVHLGQGDTPLAQARRRLPEQLIGISCHASLDLALQAQRQGADYVAFGRFFPSKTKPEAPPAPLSILGEARAALDLPLVAIGGVNAENGASLIEAGADFLAVVDSLFAAEDVADAARGLTRLFDEAQ